MLRPVRRSVRRARAWRGDVAVMLHTPGLRVEDIRWVAGRARARGDTALAEEALLTLLRRGKATEDEERLIRRMGYLPPAPAADWSVTPQPPAGRDELVIERDGAEGPVRARLTDDGARALAVWQPEWTALPPSLADQVAVCVLTRIAHQDKVASVRAADEWSAPLAAAVAEAVGVPTGAKEVTR